MAKQQTISMRPGSIMGYQGKSWRVIANDTLIQRFTIQLMEKPYTTKSFNYHAGDEISLRWCPTERI